MKDTSTRYFIDFFDTDSGARLLRARSAPFIVSFLYNEFRVTHAPFITSDDFESHLVAFLQSEAIDSDEMLSDNDEEMEKDLFTDIQNKAHQLVSQWCSEPRCYIKRYYHESKGFVVELTAGVERLFTWIENSEPTEFVGTESRFQDILLQIRELSNNMNENPAVRIAELNKEVARIKSEIKTIEKKGRASVFSPVQIQERITNISRNSRELLSDFRQIEDNFKNVLNEIYREQTETESTKGQILGYTLDTNRQLKASPQGQSFSAFWKFLSQDTENELNAHINQILSSLESTGVVYSDTFLMHLKQYLYQEGHKIIEQNRLLTDRINATLTRTRDSEYHQIKSMMIDIKSAVKFLCERTGTIPADCSMDIETRPILFFPQARYPVQKSDETNFAAMEIFDTQAIDQASLQELFSQFYIDEHYLKSLIAKYRNKYSVSQFTLADLIREYPVQKGLAEVVAWYGIAQHEEDIVISGDTYDEIEYVKDETNVKVKIPRMIFA